MDGHELSLSGTTILFFEKQGCRFFLFKLQNLRWSLKDLIPEASLPDFAGYMLMKRQSEASQY
jgi:hypothetical protein